MSFAHFDACSYIRIYTYAVVLTAAEIDSANQSSEFSTMNCSDAFFANNGVCLPRCDRWKQYSEDVSKAMDAVIIVSSAARVVFGTIALVASCVNWRKM